MAIEALGAAFNAQPAMKNVYVNLRDAGAVAFLGYLGTAAGETYTLTEAKTAGGGSAQVLATITRFHTNTGTGADAWTERTQAAGSTMVTAAAATQNCALLEVRAEELSDGYKFVKLNAAAGATTVAALPHSLRVQRAPANLPAMGV